MSGDLTQRLYVRVHVEAHGRPGMSEAASQFNGWYSVLVPKRGAAMPKAMGVHHAYIAHPPSDGSPSETERNALEQSLSEHRLALDPTTLTLTLRGFAPETDSIVLNVSGDEAEGLGDAAPELLHRYDGQHEAVGHFPENVDDLFRIWGIGFDLDGSWQFDPTVSRDVGDVGEVEHAPQLSYEEADGPRLVVPLERRYPGYDLLDRKLIYWRLPKVTVDALLASQEAGASALGYASTTRYPVIVNEMKYAARRDGPAKLELWVQSGSDPLADEVDPFEGILPRPEGATVLNRRVTTTTAVLHVEAPRAVRKGASSDVERGQGPSKLAHVRHTCVMGS